MVERVYCDYVILAGRCGVIRVWLCVCYGRINTGLGVDHGRWVVFKREETGLWLSTMSLRWKVLECVDTAGSVMDG